MKNTLFPLAALVAIACAACLPPQQTGQMHNAAAPGQGASRQQAGPISVEAPANWQLSFDSQAGFASLTNPALPGSAFMFFAMPGDPNVSATQLLQQAEASVGQGLVVTVRGGQGTTANLRGTLARGSENAAVAMEARVGAQHSFVGVFLGEASVLNQLGGPPLLGQIVATASYGEAGGVASSDPAPAPLSPLPAHPPVADSASPAPVPGNTKGGDYTGKWVPGASFDKKDPKPGVLIEVQAVTGPRDALNSGPLIVAIKKHWFTVLPDPRDGYKHMLGSLGLTPDGAHICVQVMTVDQIERQVGCVPVAAIKNGQRPFLVANGFRLLFARYIPRITSSKQERYCYFEDQLNIRTPSACSPGNCPFDPIREIIEFNCNRGAATPGELNFDEGF
jgi:hypothetical protein